MKVIAVDWFNEFKDIPEEGFINLITEVIRRTRFFPVIADIVEAGEKVGICAKCTYRKQCDCKKKSRLNQGADCTSFIKGNPQ